MSLTLQEDQLCRFAGSYLRPVACFLDWKRRYMWTWSCPRRNTHKHVSMNPQRVSVPASVHVWTRAHLWLWPDVVQWRSFLLLSLPPGEQALLWWHIPPAVPAAQQRVLWQQMFQYPFINDKKKHISWLSNRKSGVLKPNNFCSNVLYFWHVNGILLEWCTLYMHHYRLDLNEINRYGIQNDL